MVHRNLVAHSRKRWTSKLTFHSSTSKLNPSAFSLRAFSLFSAASRSFSSSFSSSSLDTLNSASSVSSCSYWALYQASDPSVDASPPGGDDGRSGAAMTGELLERKRGNEVVMRDEGVTREKVACDCRLEDEMPIGWSVKEGR